MRLYAESPHDPLIDVLPSHYAASSHPIAERLQLMVYSGPKRYDYSESLDEWVYNRDNSTLGELLDKELSAALGREVRLGVTRISRIEV